MYPGDITVIIVLTITCIMNLEKKKSCSEDRIGEDVC